MDPHALYKDKIGERITKTLGQALIDGKVTEEQAPEIAQYVLENINKAEGSGQIMDFLEQLVVKWPIFDPILTSELSQITDKKDDIAVEKAEDLIKEIDDRLAVIDAKLKEFAPSVGGAAAGAKHGEIERIRTALPTIQAELKTFQVAAGEADFRLGQLNDERKVVLGAAAKAGTAPDVSAIDSQITIERKNLREAQEQIQSREADLARLPALVKEEEALKAERVGVNKEKIAKDKDLNKAELELQKRQRKLSDFKATRAAQEQDLVDGVTNAPEAAFNRLFAKQVEQMNKVYEQEAEVLKTQTQDQNEQAMYGAIGRVGLGLERTRGIINKTTYRPLDKARLRGLRDVLLESGMVAGKGGPREAMRRVLISTINPGTRATYTAAEAEAVLTPEFITKMQPEFVKQVVGRGVMAGVFSSEDFMTMEGTQWGRGTMQQAIEGNAEFRSQLESVMGPGGLSGPGFAERWRGALKKKPWLLLLLLGIPTAMLAKAVVSVEGR